MTPQEYFEYHLVHRSLTQAFTERLAEYDITPMAAITLMALAQDDKVSMGTLGNTLQVTLPQITALTKKLRTAGLAKDAPDSKDRRERYMSITAKGKRILAKLEEPDEEE